MTVIASGFDPDQDAAIFWDYDEIGSLHLGPDGAGAAAISAPADASTGPHWVVVHCFTCAPPFGEQASAWFEVTGPPASTPSPTCEPQPDCAATATVAPSATTTATAPPSPTSLPTPMPASPMPPPQTPTAAPDTPPTALPSLTATLTCEQFQNCTATPVQTTVASATPLKPTLTHTPRQARLTPTFTAAASLTRSASATVTLPVTPSPTFRPTVTLTALSPTPIPSANPDRGNSSGAGSPTLTTPRPRATYRGESDSSRWAASEATLALLMAAGFALTWIAIRLRPGKAA